VVAPKLVHAGAGMISDSVALVRGTFLTERLVDGRLTPGAELRVDLLLVKRGDRWMITQSDPSQSTDAELSNLLVGRWATDDPDSCQDNYLEFFSSGKFASVGRG